MKVLKQLTLGASLAIATLATSPAAVLAADLTFVMDATPDSLDPHNSTSNAVASISSGVMERLIEFDPEMNLVPGLAESWESNDAATEFTFRLREGVKFHDGENFNAKAVKANLERLADQSQNLKRNSMMKVVKSVEVIDDYTVKLVLNEPFGAMLATVAHPSIVMHSPRSLSDANLDVNENPIGTGPFKFKEWVPGERYSVEKFEDYWGGASSIESIDILTVKESATAVSMLRSGEAQFVYPMPAELVSSLKTESGYEVQEVPGITVWTASMNMSREEFQDVRVRKAFNLAIDKDAFLQVVYSGHGVVPDSPIAPNTAFYSSQTAYPYDLEQAKALMKEAGYENGFSIEAWGRNTTAETRMLQFLKQQLSKINVKVDIFPLEPAVRSEKLFGNDVSPQNNKSQGLAIGGWSPSTGDADWHIRPVYGTEGIIPKIYNMAFYSSPEVDAAIDEALSSADEAVRGKAYAEAQRKIWDDAPVIWLAIESKMAGKTSELEGVYPMPDGTFSYQNAAIQ